MGVLAHLRERFRASPATTRRTSTLDWLRDMQPGTTMIVAAHSCGRNADTYCQVSADVYRATRVLAPAIWSTRHFKSGAVGVVRWR